MQRKRRLAEQMQHEQRLMAGLVLANQRRHTMDDEALAAYLKIDADALARLILSHRPRPEHKVQDILRIAEQVGCEASLLWGFFEKGE